MMDAREGIKRMTKAHNLALRWGLIGLCWHAKRGAFDGDIPRSTVSRLEKYGLLTRRGIFYRTTPAGRAALEGGDNA